MYSNHLRYTELSNAKSSTIQILHASAMAIGAVFLSIGFVFYSLEFNWIMAVMGKMSESEIIENGGKFFEIGYMYIGIGITIIVVSTILAIYFIRKN